jgi:hypothetical protein
MLAGLALGLGVASAATQWWLGNKAADAQKEASLEEERRREKERAFVLGETRARAAASGVEFESGSVQSWLSSMEAEFKRQHEWALDQAKRGADLSKLSGSLGFATGIGSSLFQYGAAKNWFRPQPAIR